jgi:hypothetical protein
MPLPKPKKNEHIMGRALFALPKVLLDILKDTRIFMIGAI